MVENRHHTPPPRGMVGPRAVHLAKQIRKMFNRVCNELGLFSGQQDIVVSIVENNGITISEIAKKHNITAATASVSVKRMEKSGFITKKADERDARIARLYPTQKALEAPEIIKSKMDSLESIITEGFTQDEIYQLSDLLERACQNMTKYVENYQSMSKDVE